MFDYYWEQDEGSMLIGEYRLDGWYAVFEYDIKSDVCHIVAAFRDKVDAIEFVGEKMDKR
jgi:hypothetical protein